MSRRRPGRRKNPPRRVALEILVLWERGGMPLSVVRDRVFRRLPMADPRDRAQADMLVTGLARRLNLVDFFVSTRSNRPLDRLDPVVRAALRLGVSELYGPGRGRGAVVVNETVAALRLAGAPGWRAGFVNAVLRRFAAEGFPPVPDDPALRLCHPAWMLERWRGRWGRRGAETIAAENNRRPGITLRARPGRAGALAQALAAAGVEAAASPAAPDGIVLPGWRGRVEDLPGYAEGAFVVQDASSQLAGIMAVAGTGPARVLDGCAGVGGKSCLLADLAPGATVTAVEPDQARRRIMAANIARLGLAGRVEAVAGRLEDLDPAAGPFDLVFIDAPCSGLGTVRRRPDIRWNRRPEDITALAARQGGLLDRAAGLVAPGGRLVHAVCSFEPEEGAEVVERFLARRPGFVLEDAAALLPAPAAACCVRDGFFTSLPGELGMDGFFCAVMSRDGGHGA